MDTDSMTPPSSPVLGYSGDGKAPDATVIEAGIVYCFSCKGKIRPKENSFHPESYVLRTGATSAVNVLRRNFDVGPKKPVLYKLFNRKFDPFNYIQLKKIFLICKKNVLKLWTQDSGHLYGSSSYTSSIEEATNPWHLRKDVCVFLNFLIDHCQLLKRLHGEKYKSIINEVQACVLPLKLWPNTLKSYAGYKNGNSCSSCLYHSFHLQLELQWTLLVLQSFEETALSDVFDNIIHLTLYLYNLEKGGSSLLDIDPFNCYCVKEFWTMMKLVLDEIQPDSKNFWKYLTLTFSSMSRSGDLFFPLWLLYNLCPLSQYALNGSFDDSFLPEMNGNACSYELVVSALKEWTFKGGRVNDMNNMMYRFLLYWGSNIAVVNVFYSHWLPKIDKSLEMLSLDPYSSVESWMSLVYSITGDSSELPWSIVTSKSSGFKDSIEPTKFADPFLSFIKLLSGHVKQCSTLEWKKLKSLIFLKLTPKTVNNFGEIGILRMSTMYVCVAAVCSESYSLIEKFFDLLENAKSSTPRQRTCTRAMSVSLLMLLRKSVDISAISSSFLKTVISAVAQIRLDSSLKDIVMTYIQFLSCFPRTPKFSSLTNLHRDSLLIATLPMWLTSCGPNCAVRTIRVMCDMSDWILSQCDQLDSIEMQNLVSQLIIRCTQYVTESVLIYEIHGVTDFKPHAELAANLTILSKLKNKDGSNNPEEIEYNGIFESMALRERVHPEISKMYLSKLVSLEVDQVAQDCYLSGPIFISDSKWIQSWLRLIAMGCVDIPSKLSCKVLGGNYDRYTGVITQDLLLEFCKLEQQWSSNEVQGMLQVLMPVCKACNGQLFKNHLPMINSIIKSCVLILSNFKFNKVYIPKLATSFGFVLLESWFPMYRMWETLSPSFLSSMKPHLIGFFKAVLENGYFQVGYEPHLQRKMIDIAGIAVLAYSSRADRSAMESHPGLQILEYINSKLKEDRFKPVLFQVLKTINTFGKEMKLSHRFIVTVGYCRNKGMKTLLILLLSGVIEAFLCLPTENPAPIMNILIFCCSLSGAAYRKQIERVFNEKMQEHFQCRSRRFLDLFTILSRHSAQDERLKECLKQNLLPILEGEIEVCEMARGVGTDQSLRVPLTRLKKELGCISA